MYRIQNSDVERRRVTAELVTHKVEKNDPQ
jgi:hypothetical protein